MDAGRIALEDILGLGLYLLVPWFSSFFMLLLSLSCGYCGLANMISDLLYMIAGPESSNNGIVQSLFRTQRTTFDAYKRLFWPLFALWAIKIAVGVPLFPISSLNRAWCLLPNRVCLPSRFSMAVTASEWRHIDGRSWTLYSSYHVKAVDRDGP